MIVFFHMLYYVSNIFWNQIIKPKLFAIENDSNNVEENDFKTVKKRTQLYELERPEDDISTEYDADYDPNRDVCVYDLLSGKLTFVPPLYIQRYQAVMKVLTQDQHADKIHKIAEFGCAEFAMFKYYKQVPSVSQVLFVDIDEELLVHKSDRVAPLTCDYLIQRESELSATLFCGDVSVPDTRMNDADVVVAIELIEHLYPPTLEDVPYNLFGVIQPYLIVITTPNGEFNHLFDDYVEGTFRHDDHKFEWTREQFACWAENLVTRYPSYSVQISGIGPPPGCKSEAQYGHCSQMAVFTRSGERNVQTISTNVGEPYKLIKTVTYPVKPAETRSQEQILFDEMTYLLFSWKQDLVPLTKLYASLSQWCSSVEELKHLLEKNCRRLVYKPEEGEYYLIDDSRSNPGSSLSDEEEMGEYEYEANGERDELIFQYENETISDGNQFQGDSYDCWDVEPSSSTRIVGDMEMDGKEVGDMEMDGKEIGGDMEMEGKEEVEDMEMKAIDEMSASRETERHVCDGIAKKAESVDVIDQNRTGEIPAKINETIEIPRDHEEEKSKRNVTEVAESFTRKETERLESEMTASKQVGNIVVGESREKEEIGDKTGNMADQNIENEQEAKIRCFNLEKYIRDSLRDDAEKRRDKRTCKSGHTSRTNNKRGGGNSPYQGMDSNDVTLGNDADVDTSEDSSVEDDEETKARSEKVKHLSREKKKLEEKIEKLIQDTEVENVAATQRVDENTDADLRTHKHTHGNDLSRSSQGNIDKKESSESGVLQNASTQGIDKVKPMSNVPLKSHVNAVVKSTADFKPDSHVFDAITNTQTRVHSSTDLNLESSHLPINSTTLSSDCSTTGSGFDSSSLNLSSILVDTTSDGLSSSNTQCEVSYILNSHITEYESSSIDDLEGKTGRNETRADRIETNVDRNIEEKTLDRTKSTHKLKDITNKTNQNGIERKLEADKKGGNQTDIQCNQESRGAIENRDSRDMRFHKESDRWGEDSLGRPVTTNILKEKSLNKEITKLGQKLENLSIYSPEKLGRTTDWVNQIPNQSMGVDGKESKETQNFSLSEKQKATRRRRSLKLEPGESSEEISRRKSLGAIGKKYQETRGLENERGDHVRQSVYQVEAGPLKTKGKGDYANKSTDQAIKGVIQAHEKSVDNALAEKKSKHRETSENVSKKFVDDLCSTALEQIKDIDTLKVRCVKQSTGNVQEVCAKDGKVETKTDYVHEEEKEDCKQVPDLVKSSEILVEHVQRAQVNPGSKSASGIKVENNNEIDISIRERHEKDKSTVALQETLETRKDQIKEFSKLADRVEMTIEKSRLAGKVDLGKDPIKLLEHTNDTKEVSEGGDVMKEIRGISKEETKETNKSENERKGSQHKDRGDVSKEGTNDESDHSADEDDYLSCAETTSSYKTGHLDTSDTTSMFSCLSGDTQFETASEYQTSYYSGSDDSDATLVESDNETYLNDEETDED